MKHETIKHLAVLTVVAALCTLGNQQAQAQHAAGDHQMLSPADLKWAASPNLPPGTEFTVIQGPLNQAVPFVARLKFPANAKVAPHYHAVIEHATVLSGVMNMGVGDKLDTSKTQALGPGSIAIMQPGTPHFIWFAEETIIQLHGVGPWTVTFVNPADDPRKK